MLRLRILSLVFAATGLAVPAHAAVLSAAGGLQGAAVFANTHVETGMNIGLGAMAAPPKPLPRVTPANTSSDSQLYAMIALGLIGLTLMRRKRYGRN